jgi:mannose-6-phosphate isomerase-like protein (cupin superfamily)
VDRYTISNLKLADDVAAGRDIDMEGRFGRSRIDSSELGVSYFRYGPGFHSTTGHHHREQEEVYVVIAGSGRIKIDDDVHELAQWDIVRLAPEAVRALEGGPEGLEIIAVGGHKPEGGDGVVVNDWWVE